MSKSIHVTDRTGRTKSELRQMRAQGHIPAIVYGSKIGSIPVAVEEKEILAVLRRNPHAILEIELPKHGKQPVLVQQIQKDTLTGQLRHIDFHQINMNEKMNTMVTIHFSGEPAGVKEGGILQVEAHEVEVRCMPAKLPSTIEIDISGLAIGDHLLVSDLALHDGLEILSDPNGMLVTILGVQKQDETVELETAEKVKAEK